MSFGAWLWIAATLALILLVGWVRGLSRSTQLFLQHPGIPALLVDYVSQARPQGSMPVTSTASEKPDLVCHLGKEQIVLVLTLPVELAPRPLTPEDDAPVVFLRVSNKDQKAPKRLDIRVTPSAIAHHLHVILTADGKEERFAGDAPVQIPDENDPTPFVLGKNTL